jgi:phosphohistidine phosphatase SixA
MLVGHNPGFETLLINVLEAEQSININKMATGTFAVVEFPDGFKRHLSNGILRYLQRRKDFIST